MTGGNNNLKLSLIREIKKCVASHPANRSENGTRYFDEPLIGFALATGGLFRKYKEIIGTFHWTPDEVLDHAYGQEVADARTVICWVLPITAETRDSNRKERRYPSREWARTRNYGELFNDIVRKTVVDLIVKRGGRAAAPMLLDDWSRVDDDRIGWASTWSERHAAYAAGLGTFSLNDGFITSLGIAHRVGSVVTDLLFETTDPPGGEYRKNCLTSMGFKCGVCIDRCPVGAITLEGHNKALCEEYTYGPAFKELSKKYSAKHVGCGLCQTDVPCENKIPEEIQNLKSKIQS